jgi:predicted enzyme related to lactoylglutathione lyase
MLLLLRWCLRTRQPAVRRTVTLTTSQLHPYLRGASLGGIALLSAMAGFAEEALFRGVIQDGLGRWIPAWAALGAASVLFGVAHWLTPIYALLAGITGLWLGALYLLAGNLLAPMVAHAAYDIVALAVLARMKPPAMGLVGGKGGASRAQQFFPEDHPVTITQSHAPGTFCWVELGTSDSEAAKRFYTGLFGWTFRDDPIGEGQFYTTLLADENPVAALYQLDRAQLAQGVPPNWLSYLATDSADRTTARARELGATVIVEPMDVFDLGRMAVVQDATGAMVGLWEAKIHTGATLVGEPNSMCWQELYTREPERSAAFYSGLLGWQPEEQPMPELVYTYFKQGEKMTGGMIQIAPEWGPIPANWTVYFAVDDCDAKAALAESLGGKVAMPPHDVPEVGRFAMLQDPQGGTFAIIKLLPM